jgi:hypothetical protein
MKFLIQKIDRQIRHDFAFALTESQRYHNWLKHGTHIDIKFFNTVTDTNGNITPFEFKPNHQKYTPIGSVEFVSQFLYDFYKLIPKPLNVPKELFHYAGREMFNGDHLSLEGSAGKFFVKSNDNIKGYCEIKEYTDRGSHLDIPIGNYQFSDVISIDSEWRAFVYEGKLVGLQNYSGDFTIFPNVQIIEGMIKMYKSAPIAYTLDIGKSEERGTFVIECHDFFSCGLYGFNEHKILPHMFYKWFHEYIKNSK